MLNRANARLTIFAKNADHEALIQAVERTRTRLLAYCAMPNHWQLVVWPRGDGDLGRWMQWLMTSHVRRYHRHYGGSGHVWQGRFKVFPFAPFGTGRQPLRGSRG